MNRELRLPLIALAIGLAALAGGLAMLFLVPASQVSRASRTSTAALGGPFTLTSSDGRTVTERTYLGKWLLIYFGYTSCPDACPTALNDMGVALDRLGSEAAIVQPIFITVDPKRDTPERLAAYLQSFDPHIVALTGTAQQIAAVAKEYQVYYAAQPAAPGTDYAVDHSSFFYLISPDGRFADLFAGDLSGQGIAARVGHFIKTGG